MDQLFTIGKMASLTGVSIQTLRYYDKLGLLIPTYINPITNYRYYSYDHLQIINRIRYLQNLGLSLSDIKEVFEAGDLSVLRSKLNEIQQSLHDEMERLRERCENIEWYISYFNEDNLAPPLCVPYFKHFNERYILVCNVEDGNETDAYLRFNEIKNCPDFQKLDCYLWHIYRIKFNTVASKHFCPLQLGFMLRRKPEEPSPHVLVVPGGNYICFKCHIRTPGWDPELFLKFFSSHNVPDYVLACEYEKDLFEFSNSIFEVQALYLGSAS